VSGHRIARGAAAVLAVGALTGCQKVTRTVTSSVSPCFRVLPVAHQAVEGQGAFVDVVRIRGRSVAHFPRVAGPPGAPAVSTTTTSTSTTSAPAGSTSTTAPGASRDVCVVAYRGTFDAGRVHLLTGPNRSGTYALVVVSVRAQRVRAVVLTDHLPPPLHSH
jgi:hypothetical protein